MPDDAMERRADVSDRAKAVQRIAAYLRHRSFPRVQMVVVVALTGAFGLLASFLLLHLGVDSMAVRYPLALSVAYLFFFALIGMWLRAQSETYVDALDLVGDFATHLPARTDASLEGDHDVGGAEGPASFESPSADAGGGLDALTGSVGSVVEADELAIPLVAIALATALVTGLVVSAAYVVYVAPVLFAEVLLDGTLSYALFRHLSTQERSFWLTSAVRHTIVPFAATAVFLVVLGATLSAYAPGATSVGQVLAHAAASGPER